MQYVADIEQILRGRPGAGFRMSAVVLCINPSAHGRQRDRIRQAVLRAMSALKEAGDIEIVAQGKITLYRWKCDMR